MWKIVSDGTKQHWYLEWWVMSDEWWKLSDQKNWTKQALKIQIQVSKQNLKCEGDVILPPTRELLFILSKRKIKKTFIRHLFIEKF